MTDYLLPYLSDNARKVARYFVKHWDTDESVGYFSFAIMYDSGVIARARGNNPTLNSNPIDVTPSQYNAGIRELAMANLLVIEDSTKYERSWWITLSPALRMAVYNDFKPFVDPSGLLDVKRLAEMISDLLLPKLDKAAEMLQISADDLRAIIDDIKAAKTESEREIAVRSFWSRIGSSADIFTVGQATAIFAQFVAGVIGS